MKLTAVSALALMLSAGSALAFKPCEELKAEIAAKIDANGVPSYTLAIVANDAEKTAEGQPASEGKVVGTCEGGTKKIVYTRK